FVQSVSNGIASDRRVEALRGVELGHAPVFLGFDPQGASTLSDHGDAKTGGLDTIPGDVTTTFTLSIGGSQTGLSNAPGDDDWFRVDLVAGQSYVFTAAGFEGADGPALIDPYLELYNSAGLLTSIDDDAGPGRDAMLRFTATQSGTYYLNARAWEPETGP